MTIEVFGITGTNGKTTVTYMLKSIMEEAGRECGLIGTIKHVIGKKQYEALNTTPSVDIMKKYFHELSEQGIGTCIMEVSSHGLEQGRIDGTEIHYSGFTNLSRDHLDYHITMENYFKAKEKLFAVTRKGMCINIDDVYGRRLYEKFREQQYDGILDGDIKIDSYSCRDKSADYYGRLKSNSIRGIVMEMFDKGAFWGCLHIDLPGETTAYNSVLAMAMARQAGVEKEHVIGGLEKITGVPGRFQRVKNEKNTDVVVDFAHTPDAMENLMKLACELKKGRLITVFGCGGNRDSEKRSIMGRIAGTYSDYCVITSDNPRYENPQYIAAEIEAGMKLTECAYSVALDRREAIKTAIEYYKEGDLIVIAGKGHEKYQLINGQKLPFDDEEIVKEIIHTKE